jgi:hypothetical protein
MIKVNGIVLDTHHSIDIDLKLRMRGTNLKHKLEVEYVVGGDLEQVKRQKVRT